MLHEFSLKTRQPISFWKFKQGNYSDILILSEGEWKVSIKTNGHASASTQAQVTITVYGHKGNSGPISLGSGDGSNFKSGSTDEFDVSSINMKYNAGIAMIYKLGY